jgi:hypothetical protein
MHIKDRLQVLAHGDRSLVIKETDERIWVGRALLKETPEQMYRDFAAAGGKASRSVYLFACDQASCGMLKQMGALDVTCEIHGRQQFELLSKLLDEVADTYPVEAKRCTHIKERLERCHQHVRHKLKSHMTTTSSCADHCLRCHFSDPTRLDASLATPCGVAHTLRCAECCELEVAWLELDDLYNSLHPGNEQATTQLDEWRKLSTRARTRIDYYVAHEMRLLNEGFAPGRAMEGLTQTSCKVVADYKMRFLPSVQVRSHHISPFHRTCLLASPTPPPSPSLPSPPPPSPPPSPPTPSPPTPSA